MYAYPMVFIHQPCGMSYWPEAPHHRAVFRVNQTSGTAQVAIPVLGVNRPGLPFVVVALWLAAGARYYLSLRGRT